MKRLMLPPRRLSKDVPHLPAGCRRLMIVGANGAGKSRFAARLIADNPGAMDVSALRALYGGDAGGGESQIDRAFESVVSRGALLRGDLRGEFNRLIALLIDEEAVTLLTQKYVGDVFPGPTRLERLMELWSEIFPDNRMLLDSGRLLFSRLDEGDSYGTMRMSDGEKAVVFYLGCGLFAPEKAPMVVDNPGEFLNRALVRPVWDAVERVHPGPMVYVTHDLEFAAAPQPATSIIWVKSYDAELHAWDYELLPEARELPQEVIQALLGPRKPVLFIEGDGVNSIDAKLYPLVFREYAVKSLGSCNKVIEATRTFNQLSALHALDATGIVDRDRRAEREVSYLRNHHVLVPDVAEIENILMLEDVVRAVASFHGRDENRVMAKVSRTLLKLFAVELEQQALLHTRHRVKMTVEYTIDRRFSDIRALERHMAQLVRDIRPAEIYQSLVEEFRGYVARADYAAVLRVYNRKSMLTETNVGPLTGVRGGDRSSYVEAVIAILRGNSPQARRIADAVRHCFGL